MKIKHFLNATLVLSLFLTANCTHAPKEHLPERQPQTVSDKTQASVFFGENLQESVKKRVLQLLKTALPNLQLEKNCSDKDNAVEFHFGTTIKSKTLISTKEKSSLDEEGFIIKSQQNGNCTILAVDGKNSLAKASVKQKRGLSFGVYEVLQDIGFRFLHPFKPTLDALNLSSDKLKALSRTENPRWPVRSIHLHTMHPLELTNLVNAWGIKGPDDEKGFNELLPYWSLYMEWLIAHKQNEVEWMLLWDPEHAEFNQSDIRKRRLKLINQMSHDWGIESGAVTPLRFVQQNGWTLLRNHEKRKGTPNEKQENIKEIKTNLDWLLEAGFTAIGGELGEGEFSSAPAEATIEELNTIADHLSQKEIPYRVKVHVSQKQFAKGYLDPGTKKDINFNYLPLYTKSHVGVLPHTIQIYSLDDPAPTYDNKNFMDMFRFIKMAATGAINGQKREVLFYPETAYWVSYDVDVPLFLPVYAYRRVHDLRMIAQDEDSGDMKKANAKIQGQSIFSSGWEWGYWFNDVITAEAAWNPTLDSKDSLTAFADLTARVLRLDKNSDFIQKLKKISDEQHRLLVLGEVNGKQPDNHDKRNGIAYLAGADTWDEIGILVREPLLKALPGVGKIPLTQPSKFRDEWVFKKGLYMNENFYMNEAKYNAQLRPLLSEMSRQFKSHISLLQEMNTSSLPKGLQFYADEFLDGVKVNSHRADFVFKLYETRLSASKNQTPDLTQFENILSEARKITQKRISLIPMKDSHKGLLTSWESSELNNPTDYHFGYLWSSYNLFYWQREFNKLAGRNSAGSLCYMNITKVSELEGKEKSAITFLESLGQRFGSTKDCAKTPTSEPNLQTGW